MHGTVRRAMGCGAAAFALALAGCGGGESDEDQVRSTLGGYVEAFVGGDGKRACDLMTDDTRRDFVSQVSQVTRTGDCARAVRTLRRLGGDAMADALGTAQIQEVEVDGERASAQLSARGAQSKAQLQKVDGEWRITGVPTTP